MYFMYAIEWRDSCNTGLTAIGVSIAILVILSMILIIIIIVLAWYYKRKSTKQKLYTDSPYSTLSREMGQQIQPQSIQMILLNSMIKYT